MRRRQHPTWVDLGWVMLGVFPVLVWLIISIFVGSPVIGALLHFIGAAP